MLYLIISLDLEERGPRGNNLKDMLMFDLDVDLEADDAVGPKPVTPKCNSRRPRFFPC